MISQRGSVSTSLVISAHHLKVVEDSSNIFIDIVAAHFANGDSRVYQICRRI